MNQAHEANRASWDAIAPHWQAKIDADGEWRNAAAKPENVFRPEELEVLEAVGGKAVCVLGSGDNLAVFALARLGARVTSIDFSGHQLAIAAERAGLLGLDIRFIEADVTDLRTVKDAKFDFVYTGGHVAVWVSDLRRYYREAGRILATGGLLVVSEYHPFRRIWAERPDRLEKACRYLDPGPFRYDRSREVPGAGEGSLPSYEFHWTVADYVAALLEAGCRLTVLREVGDGSQSWEAAPLSGLPETLLLVGEKE